MKKQLDGKPLCWIYTKSKKQRLPLLVLMLGNILLAACAVAFALVAREILDSVTGNNRNFSRMAFYSCLLLCLILVQLVLRLVCRNGLERVAAKLEITLKSSLFHEILHKQYSRITTYHSGELLNRLVNDVTVVSDGVTSILPGFSALLTRLGGAFGALVFLDRTFALIFLTGGTLLFFFTKLFRGLLKRLHKQVQEADGKVRSFLQEAIESLLMVKAFSIQPKTEAKAEELQQEHYQLKMKRRSVNIFANAGISFVFQLGYLFSLIFCSYQLYLGHMTVGTLTAVLQLVNQVQAPFVNLSGLMPKYYAMLASAERMMEIEALPNESTVTTCRSAENKPPFDFKQAYLQMERLVFSHVTFGYQSDTLILYDVCFFIEKGDFLAITGLSGIGKSTLLKLMLGVYPQFKGKIFLQTSELQIPISWQTRSLFAYVPQGNFLLSGTIRENLTFVHEQATEEEIEQALRVSCCNEFLCSLPNGLDTVISEKGHGLSEGQVQRLAIARALLSGAPILLLDEITSALDEITEAQLLRNLRELPEITCVIISHKQAAVEICNKVLHIEGKCVRLEISSGS